jgi:phosphoglycerol transferase MdoB-like AlkP superfamily enzyme
MTRLGLVLGLMLTVAIATWWLGATRIAIEQTATPETFAEQALFVLALLRAAMVALVALRTGLVLGYRSGVRASLPIVVVAWPLVTLAWAASTRTALQLLAVESALVVAALALPALGRGCAQVMRVPARQ